MVTSIFVQEHCGSLKTPRVGVLLPTEARPWKFDVVCMCVLCVYAREVEVK